MNDNQNLNNNFNKVIKHIQESVVLVNYKRKSKRIIPILINIINNIEFVIISFALIITYHDKNGLYSFSSNNL